VDADALYFDIEDCNGYRLCFGHDMGGSS